MSPVSSPRDTPPPTRPTGRRGRSAHAARGPLTTAVTAALTVLLLAGCALRLETPPPAEPSPDAVEQVRARTVADALDLGTAAEQAKATAEGGAEAVAAVLDTVATFSAQHARQLGGVYDSGLDDEGDADGAGSDEADSDGAAPEGAGSDGAGSDEGGAVEPSGSVRVPPATVQDVLDTLAATTSTARADAAAVEDGPLARLVASVAAARADLAARLAAALGVPDPTPAPVPGTGPDVSAGDDRAPEGGGAADGSAPGDATGDQPDTTDGPSTTDQATSGADAPPAGLPAADLAALVLTHDQAGYGLEVVAARLTGDGRSRALAAARAHRSTADAWALRAGTAGTTQDPRRASYALPPGLDDPEALAALARTLETAVADACAAAIAHAATDQRAPLVTGLHQATEAARGWGATAVPFPGLPEASAAG